MIKSLEELYNIIVILRSENGCPWDRAQTIFSLNQLFLEECFELSDAIQENDSINIAEELGDVSFMLLLLSYIADQDQICNISTVYQKAKEKLIFRHPHVFDKQQHISQSDVVYNWEKLKKQEKSERMSIFDGIPKSLPMVMRFDKLMRKLKNNKQELANYKDSQNNSKKSQLKNLLIDCYQDGQNITDLIKEINSDIENIARNKGL